MKISQVEKLEEFKRIKEQRLVYSPVHPVVTETGP